MATCAYSPSVHAASDTRKDEREHKSPTQRGITSVGGFSLPDTCVIESVIFRAGDSVRTLYVMYALRRISQRYSFFLWWIDGCLTWFDWLWHGHGSFETTWIYIIMYDVPLDVSYISYTWFDLRVSLLYLLEKSHSRKFGFLSRDTWPVYLDEKGSWRERIAVISADISFWKYQGYGRCFSRCLVIDKKIPHRCAYLLRS